MNGVVATAATGAMLLAGCADKGRPSAPRPRVVSLSPGLTGLLFEMGVADHLVGVTQFCELPDGKRRPVVGSQLDLNEEGILSVEPNVVLVEGTITEGRKRAFDRIRSIYPEMKVEQFRLNTLGDIRAAVLRLGRLGGWQERAKEVVAAFDARLAAVRARVAGRPRPNVLFTNGYRRPLVAAEGSFMDEMIELAGGTNCGAKVSGLRRWRSTDAEGILSAQPDVLICYVNAAQAKAARSFWLGLEDLPAARSGRVHVVTDRRWTIKSTHLAEVAGELAALIHPGASSRAASRPAAARGAGGGS